MTNTTEPHRRTRVEQRLEQLAVNQVSHNRANRVSSIGSQKHYADPIVLYIRRKFLTFY
jgi:hypothetical protein